MRSRMLLCSHVLQIMHQCDNSEFIFTEITTKIQSFLSAAHVAIYELDGITDISGHVIAEAIATDGEACSQIHIESILNDEYAWLQSTRREIVDRYVAGKAKCEMNLARIFAGKPYLLVPIALAKSDHNNGLWGFLTVHQGSEIRDEAVRGSWDEDDVLMIQQIAMQIEIMLHQENQRLSLLNRIGDIETSHTALSHWTEQFRSLVEQTPNVSYVSPIANTPEFAYISPQLKELLAVPSEEWNAGFFNSWANYVHPDDRDRVQQEVRKTIETGEPFCSEYRFVTRTGKIIWVCDNARIGLASDEKTKVLRGSVFDISDRKETELKFKAIFNNTFQFVGLLSLDGILLEANQTALDFCGITHDEVIGKPFWETHWFSYSEDIQNHLQQSVREAAQGEFIRYEVDAMGESGIIVPVDFSIRPLKDESGEVFLLMPEGRDISGFKAIEQNLRKNEAMLLESQQIAKLGNWQWNVANDEIIWSPVLFKIFGIDPSLGTPSYAEHLLCFIEEDRKKLDLAVQQAVNNGDPYHLELQIIHSDQSYRYINAIGHVEYDNNGQISRLYGTVQDISDRKLIEQNLRDSEARLVEAQTIAKLGNWQWDLLSNEIIGSPELYKILGLDPALGTFSYENVSLLYVQEDRESLELAIDRARKYGESYCQELRVLPYDSYRYLEAIGHAKFDANGEVALLYGTFQDISDRKCTQDKLEAAKFAEVANKAKTEFLSVMSHELRTPMNAVIGMTEILANTPLSDQQQEYLGTIQTGGEILLSVINSILDFSRIESGHLELEEHPFKLQNCIDEVIKLMAVGTAEKSIKLVAIMDLDVPQSILGDYARLRQIIVNLVSNAIKFTEAGQIVITVSSQLVDAQTDAYELQFTIRDTGIGIAPEAIAKLFKAFSQADSSITRQYGGTGLGLAISKQLCELMGGQISVKSTVGQGSIFSFSIRTKAIAIEETEQAIAPSRQDKTALNNPDFAKLYPLKILVAEDHPVNQKILLLTLEGLGYQTEAVNNGQKAVNACLQQPYDVIFMDIQMPIMDGLTATKAIRQLPHQPCIIGLSADAFDESSGAALDVGMNYYLTKPVRVQNLVAILPEIYQSQTQNVNITKKEPPIDIETFTALENSIGKQNIQEVLAAYLEHSGNEIDSMQAAFAKHDFATIEAENHSLKGGSATFGVMDLYRSCQALEILCKKQMEITEHSTEDINKIASLLKTIAEQYQYVLQWFQTK